jgi:Flp pilus assembly protein TadD
MRLSEKHLRSVLCAAALTLIGAGCHALRADRNDSSDCVSADAQPGRARLDQLGDYKFDRPSAPPATFPVDEAHPPLRVDSSADASHSEEIDPPAGAPLDTPDPDIMASRLKARGARITRDAEQAVLAIDLSNTDTIDDDLQQLYLFDHLQQLNLGGTRITNVALEHLASAGELEFLGLMGTQIDDEGLPKIAELPRLRFLGLAGTRITDAGLETLSQIQTLEAVNLRSTRVTTEGIAALQARLPACRIVVETREETKEPENARRALPAPAGAGGAARSINTRTSGPSRGVTPAQLNLSRLYPTPNPLAAQQQLELVLRQKLSDPEVLHALAAVRAANGDWREAEAAIRAALDQCPDDRGLQFDLAVTLAQCQELEAAFNEFERAVDRAAAHYNMGVLLAEQGRFAAGRQHFLEAVKLDPTLDAARSWVAYIDGDGPDAAVDPHAPGLLSEQAFQNLFGSLLARKSPEASEVAIEPADAARTPVATVQPASAAFRPIAIQSRPIRNW